MNTYIATRITPNILSVSCLRITLSLSLTILLCIIVTLPHCIVDTLSHCIVVTVPHCITVSHYLTLYIHCHTVSLYR